MFQEAQIAFLTSWNSESWRNLASQFYNIIAPEDIRHLNRDIQRMEMNFNKHALEHERSRRTILETWHFLSGQYPYLATLARAILVLPSSTI